MTAPYDWDTLVDSAIRQKPKEPERWRNRYRAIGDGELDDGRKVRDGETYLSNRIYPSAEAAVETYRVRVLPICDATCYLYLGPEKQP